MPKKSTKEVVKDLELRIKLGGIEDIAEFSARCNEYEGDIDVKLGRYVIDGKSILGLYALDISKELVCVIHESVDKDATDIVVAALSKFAA